MNKLTFFENIRNTANIVLVISKKINLKKISKEYIGICPFHDEKTPSFKVNPVKNFYYCFGCGAHGDSIKFTSQMLGVSYMDAANTLAQEYGIAKPNITRQDLRFEDEKKCIEHALEIANKSYIKNCNEHIISFANKQKMTNFGYNAVQYLINRGIQNSEIKKFEIGISISGNLNKDLKINNISNVEALKAGLIAKSNFGNIYEVFHNRIIFPIRNQFNKLIGFGGRVIDDKQPKYLNSPETILFKKHSTLYAHNLATSSAYKNDSYIVVEGYMDCIMMHKYGFDNTVATLGTAICKNQLEIMWRVVSNIIICMDGDIAGRKAAYKAITLALEHITTDKQIFFVFMPENIDPDTLLNKEGAESFAALIANKYSVSEAIWYFLTHSIEHKTAEQHAKLEHDVKNLCDSVVDQTLKKSYLRFFRQKIWELFKKSNDQNFGNDNSDQKQHKKIYTQQHNIYKNDAVVSKLNVDFKDIDSLEYSICALLVQNLSLLNNNEVHDNFENLKFDNNQLHEFKSYMIGSYNEYYKEISSNNIGSIGLEDFLVGKLKQGKYKNVYYLFLNFDQLYNSTLTPDLLWKLFVKNHHVIMLKNSYYKMVNDPNKIPDYPLIQFLIKQIRTEEKKLHQLMLSE